MRQVEETLYRSCMYECSRYLHAKARVRDAHAHGELWRAAKRQQHAVAERETSWARLWRRRISDLALRRLRVALCAFSSQSRAERWGGSLAEAE